MLPLIIFTHIPKTAGSTITSVIDAVYRRGEIAKIYSHSDGPAFMAALSPRVRFLTGHQPYGLHRFTERPCRYFTILRDPAERVLSLYYYLRRATDHKAHARIAAGQETMLDVIKAQPNEQTRFLAGLTLKDPMPDDERLALAKAHLEREFAVLGLAERFDESLLLLQAAFGWRVHHYRTQNATPRRPRRESASDEVRAALAEHHQLDQQLYDYAQTRFAETLAQQTPDFAARLAHLRRRTAQMSRLYRITEGAHGLLKRLHR